MDLTTRCPQCGTTFLASLDQLQLRKGYVRCVQCAHIFDGYEAVVAPSAAPDKPSVAAPVSDEWPASTPPPQPAVPSVVRGRREFTISDESVALSGGTDPSWKISDGAHSAIVGNAEDIPEHIIASPADTADRADSGHVNINMDHVHIEPDHRGFVADDVRIDTQEHGSPAYHHTAGWDDRIDSQDSSFWRSLVSLVWVVAIVAGVLILALQAVYVFRVQLAENIPALRPGLERMCTALNCTVAYSRQPDMIVITQSSLQQDPAESDSDGRDTVLLQLTMRNVHESPQEWPMLVLDLTDFSGARIARKHLPKDVYLPATMVDMPFPANSERKVVLPLKMQGLHVNGYKLTAVFP